MTRGTDQQLSPVLPTAGSDPGIFIPLTATISPTIVIPDFRTVLRARLWWFRTLCFVPGRILQPTFQSIPSPIAHVTQLLAPALGTPQQILANTGARHRQIIQSR